MLRLWVALGAVALAGGEGDPVGDFRADLNDSGDTADLEPFDAPEELPLSMVAEGEAPAKRLRKASRRTREATTRES